MCDVSGLEQCGSPILDNIYQRGDVGYGDGAVAVDVSGGRIEVVHGGATHDDVGQEDDIGHIELAVGVEVVTQGGEVDDGGGCVGVSVLDADDLQFVFLGSTQMDDYHVG